MLDYKKRSEWGEIFVMLANQPLLLTNYDYDNK